MKIRVFSFLFLGILLMSSFSNFEGNKENEYTLFYQSKFQSLGLQLSTIISKLKENAGKKIDSNWMDSVIFVARKEMKSIDFWTRYLDPNAQKNINGPLEVEWETEVFEKFEKPYRREGSGLFLVDEAIHQENETYASLLPFFEKARAGVSVFQSDSVRSRLTDFHHFYFCNRLYLMNLAAIYSTGFECPKEEWILPEYLASLNGTLKIYQAFNRAYPNTAIHQEYLALFQRLISFVEKNQHNYETFDHFELIKEYLNPLYGMNQSMIKNYGCVSKSLVDYSINSEAKSLFSKDLYLGQETKGVFRRVTDSVSLEKIEKLGELFFFDPIFSLNNERACASCHQPDQFFTRNDRKTEMDFQQKSALPRNTLSVVNSIYNHLLMDDGKHYSLTHQALGVIENPTEMNEKREQVLQKILSCQEYKKELNQLVKLTPSYPEISMEHVVSCMTQYMGKFSSSSSPFDLAVQGKQKISPSEKAGFNVFMGKGQCGTCHFIPHFNGVKPPYVSSEFEVLGTPEDKEYRKLSPDDGRYGVHPVKEMKNAFRTGTLKNIAKTGPYMHNGVFSTLEEVIDFYNHGGGAGHGLLVENQTLSSDSLHLNAQEKKELIAFLEGLTEKIPMNSPPKVLPKSKISALNQRKPGGNYP